LVVVVAYRTQERSSMLRDLVDTHGLAAAGTAGWQGHDVSELLPVRKLRWTLML
jgi:hypothetical protein